MLNSLKRLLKNSSLPLMEPRSETYEICVSSLISIVFHQKMVPSKFHQNLPALLIHLEMLVHDLFLCIPLCEDSHYHSLIAWDICTYVYSMFLLGIAGHLWQLRNNNSAILFCCCGFRQTFANLSFMHKIRSSQLWLPK